MKSTYNNVKKISVILAFALVFIIAFSLILTAGGGIAFAATSPKPVDTLTVGHISDIHYFPLEYCYRDRYNDNYDDSDFNFAATGDTKLVLESGVVLNKMVAGFITDITNGTGDIPSVVLATGDLCKNGERVALIDVANTLRYLQNKIRQTKLPDFQILVMPGNHDLYNGDGQLYENKNGSGYPADVVTAAEFALIFAGLGFPDASMTGKLADDSNCVNLTDYFPAGYYTNGADGYTGLIGNVTGVEGAEGYVQSVNASEYYDFKYYNEELQKSVVPDENGKGCNYNAIGHENNVLSYVVTLKKHTGYTVFALDSSDREDAEAPVYVRVSPKEFKEKFIDENSFKREEFYFAVTDENTNKISYNREKDFAKVYDAIKTGNPVYMNAKVGHITGGRITESCLNWVKSNAADATNSENKGVNEETIIAAFHHNIVPHFTMEDEILKDFTLYNWEYTAKEFLKTGIRYAFTGHMHSSDTAVYTDAKGRTLTDTETGSAVSYDSPRRYVSISRHSIDGRLCEQYKSRLIVQKDSLFKTADRPGVTEKWDEAAFTEAGNNFEAQIDANPEYYISTLHHGLESFKHSYNTFVNDEIYGQLVSRMLDHFLSDKMITSLLAPVHNLFGKDGIIGGAIGDLLSSYAPMVDKIITYVLDVTLGGTDKGTLYGVDKGYPFKEEEYGKLTDYLRAVVDSIVGTGVNSNNGMMFGSEELGKVNAGEMLAYSFVSHIMGRELLEDYTAGNGPMYVNNTPDDPVYRARLKAGLDDFFAKCDDGSFASEFLNSVIDPLLKDENSLIDALLNYKFDFTNNAGFTEAENKKLNGLAGVLNEVIGILIPNAGNVKIDMSNIVLGDLIETLMPALSGLLSDKLGFTITGTNVKEILTGFIDSYLTDSFNIGLGGIAKGIVISLASDSSKDMANIQFPSNELCVKPYTTYGDDVIGPSSAYCYINGVPANGNPNAVSDFDKNYNKPTSENGRLPSRVTANFATNGINTSKGSANGANKFVINFYTAEDVFATFKFKDAIDGEWKSVSTTDYTNRDKVNAIYRPDKFLSATETGTFDGVKVTLKTEAIPQYVPFIDLGLLTVTHSEISRETSYGDKLYTALDRDNAPKNSVLYYNRHTVTIENLNADTQYYYDLAGTYGDKTDAVKDRISYSLSEINNGGAAYTFRTAPDKSAKNFDFLAMADIQGMIQGMYDESFNVMSDLMKDETLGKYSFIVNAGDMTDNGKNYTQWAYALDTYQKTFMNTSTFLAAGNHEKDSDALGRFYNFTQSKDYTINPGGNGYYYSFDYGTAHFLVLDTNDLTNNNLSSNQIGWLERDLSANSDAKWKFVLMHKSMFSSGAHSTDAEVIGMRNTLVPLFNMYGVNAVFGGHDHTYTVTNLIGRDGTDKGAVTTSDGTLIKNSGTLYITLGTAGTKFYDYKENDDVTPYVDNDNSINGTLDTQTFGRISIKGDTLTYTGYKYNADAIDGENKFEQISNLKIASDNALVVSEIKKDNTAVKSSYKIGFTEKSIDKLEINKTKIPRDFKIIYIAGGKEYQDVSEIAINGKEVKIDIAVKDKEGTVSTIKTVTVERENYILIIAGSAGGAAALVLIIVLAIVISAVVKRKKSKNKKDGGGNSDGVDNSDGGANAEIISPIETVDTGAMDVSHYN